MGGKRRLSGRFWRFWSAAALANLGDGIRLAAFPLLAASLTDDPFAVAAVGAAAALPWLLTGLVAGSLSDRRGAGVLLVGADTARIVVLLGLVGALLAGAATLPLVAVVAFALGVAETARDTAASTVVPRLVPAALLERAYGRLVAGEVVGNEFVGPLIGAALFAAGVALPFAANSALLAIAVLLVLYLPASLLTVRPLAPDGDAVRDGVRAGLGWLARHRVLRGLLIAVALVALADAAWFAVFVLYTQVELGAGAIGFGGYLAIGAAGGLVGALAAARLTGQRRHRAVLLGQLRCYHADPGTAARRADRLGGGDRSHRDQRRFRGAQRRRGVSAPAADPGPAAWAGRRLLADRPARCRGGWRAGWWRDRVLAGAAGAVCAQRHARAGDGGNVVALDPARSGTGRRGHTVTRRRAAEALIMMDAQRGVLEGR